MLKVLKRILGLAIVAGMVVAVVHFAGVDTGGKQGDRGGRRGGKAGAGEVVPVATATTTTKDVDVFLEGVGTARARNVVTVKPQVDGKIIAINFREGQDVKKGDVLARIDPTTYRAQLDQALAKKALDEVQLANAKLDYERYSKVGPNVVTQKQIDTQRALVAQWTAQVQADDAAIANAQAILSYTEVVAPIDGRTGLRLVDEGNLVRSGDAGIVTITQIRPIAVLFTLPQQELPRITRGMSEGTLKASALDAQGLAALDEGTLEVVDNQVDQSTGTIRLKAEFPNAQLQLWPGQFTNVRLRVEVLKQVVVAPTAAIQRGPSGPFVYVVGPENKVSLHNVKIAHQSDVDTVVSRGLETGASVVTAGFARLRDGATVSIAPADGEAADAPAKDGKGQRGGDGNGKGGDKRGKRGGKADAQTSSQSAPDGAQRIEGADASDNSSGVARAAEIRVAPAATAGNGENAAAEPGRDRPRGEGKRHRREAAGGAGGAGQSAGGAGQSAGGAGQASGGAGQ